MYKKWNFTLYHKISLLTFFAVLVSLLTEYIFMFALNDHLRIKERQNDAKVVLENVIDLPIVKVSLKNKNNKDNKEDLQQVINAISQATGADIIIYDNEKSVFVSSKMIPHEGNGVDEAQNATIEDSFLKVNTISTAITDSGNQLATVFVTKHPSIFEKERETEYILVVLIANLAGLFVGIIGSVFLARNIKNILFGLEPKAIANIMQERSAMMDSVQEGLLSINKNGEIVLINSRAKEIFEYAGFAITNPLGEKIEKIYTTDMQDVLIKGASRIDFEEKINNVTVITNQFPIKIKNEIVGAITTFRLKTELEDLAEKLTGVRNYADALRAQTHEFMNKMHVILGLIELKEYDELKQYVRGIAAHTANAVNYVSSRLKDPILSGFIIGKLNRAKELDIEFMLTEESNIPEPLAQAYVDKLISIIGNLINNAFEAVEDYERERIVLLSIFVLDEELVITVEDSGAGIKPDVKDKIFEENFSVKGENRGIGLHLVKQILDDIDGKIEVESIVNEGSIFIVKIPYIRKLVNKT